MYAVIFKASCFQLDDDYFATAKKMRQLAQQKYGCLNFVSVFENGEEISISYWQSLEHISLWKNDPDHLVAQQKGQSLWYKHYQVEIAQIEKSYAF